MEPFKIPYRYKGVHQCEAVVFCCIDFRFWKETMEFVEKSLGLKSYDFPKIPGGAKAFNEPDVAIPISCTEVACNLHRAGKIILINHSDCGAYGGLANFKGDRQAEEKFHFSELKKAKEKLAKKFPGKKIMTFYARLDENENEIEFIETD